MACCCGNTGGNTGGLCGCLNSSITPPSQAVITMAASVANNPLIFRICPCIQTGVLALFNRTIVATAVEDILLPNNYRRVLYRYIETTTQNLNISCSFGQVGNASSIMGTEFGLICGGTNNIGITLRFVDRYIFNGCSPCECFIGGFGREVVFTLSQTNTVSFLGGLERFCPGGPMNTSINATAEFRGSPLEWVDPNLIGPGSIAVSFL